MSGQIEAARPRCRYEAARREAIYTAERLAVDRLHPPHTRTAPSRRQVTTVLVLWALFLGGGLWLAAHDPGFLSRAAQCAIEGTP
ncbi:MAG: hypothetical protein ACYC0F_05295 [Rhodanobacter sp.]